ncbi:hypothetical protein CEUSTIGMA_g9850.t1 [Chlamydomonas eustigma]|uniref:HVA22-like protein n=1 Tax=Chlamydomonas eustigma TaxID=1157962 RepID=A0A250XHL9_9CHLO|nr:hypothetical protein CEUSTIGMA_g9850.t1 [Chlamydomonas eustigma]|eukprot:GAX82422.1 hypothetical protein CEUSTIGMA_g9850.t1 [Chlamydomonas eustigma]
MLLGQSTSQIAIILLGYGWPAYQSYKAINLKNSQLERQWLIYWIVLAFYFLAQWVGDSLVFWLPLYYEAKVATVVMLWHPRVKGAEYLFSNYLSPMLRAHEAAIDRGLVDSKTRALDYINSQIQRVKDLASTSSSTFDVVKSFTEQTPATQRRHPRQGSVHVHRE